MTYFALRLPDSLFERACILAERTNCSLNQLFAVAIAEQIATIDAEAFFAERTGRAAAQPGGNDARAQCGMEIQYENRFDGRWRNASARWAERIAKAGT